MLWWNSVHVTYRHSQGSWWWRLYKMDRASESYPQTQMSLVSPLWLFGCSEPKNSSQRVSGKSFHTWFYAHIFTITKCLALGITYNSDTCLWWTVARILLWRSLSYHRAVEGGGAVLNSTIKKLVRFTDLCSPFPFRILGTVLATILFTFKSRATPCFVVQKVW